MSRPALLVLPGLAVLLGVLPQAISSRAEKPRVAICCTSQESYKEAAEALRESLEGRGFDCLIVRIPDESHTTDRAQLLRDLKEAAPVCIAATGADAYKWAVDFFPSTPAIFLLIPNARDALSSLHSEPIGIASDISPDDWMQWIRLSHPGVTNLCILHSDRTRKTVLDFEQAATKLQLHVKPIQASADDFAAAVNDLTAAHCDGVLMIPDARVYNGPNIQRLLLWGIRAKKPVWGFSQKIAKAGAMSSLYPDNKDIGRQAADLISKLREGSDGKKPGIEYPRKVCRAANLRTAELIGVKLPPEAASNLTERLGESP